MPSEVVHIVLFRFRDDVDAAQRAEVSARFLALADSERDGERYIRGIRSGPQTSPEGLGHGFELGFVVEFASAADRDHYLGPPHTDGPGDAAHAAFAAFVTPLLAPGGTGVLVFDLVAD